MSKRHRRVQTAPEAAKELGWTPSTHEQHQTAPEAAKELGWTPSTHEQHQTAPEPKDQGQPPASSGLKLHSASPLRRDQLDQLVTFLHLRCDEADASPDPLVREVSAAHRAVLNFHWDLRVDRNDERSSTGRRVREQRVGVTRAVVRLAGAYRSHPDFDPRWWLGDSC